MAIHHSAINDEKPQFDRIKIYHNNGASGKWPKGYGIQYHAFIERTGERITSYNIDHITWHSGSQEWNRKSFAVCLAGDFRYQQPTEAQLGSLFGIWKDQGYPVIVYHKDIRPEPTACPGNFPFVEELERRRMLSLQNDLRLAERALQRFEGTSRGNLLKRFIGRLRAILGL